MLERRFPAAVDGEYYARREPPSDAEKAKKLNGS